jgi:hypothetical protein
VTVGDETLSITQWSEKTGLSFGCIYARIERGWCNSCAILVPLGASRNTCHHQT